jgi:hypothetical protein
MLFCIIFCILFTKLQLRNWYVVNRVQQRQNWPSWDTDHLLSPYLMTSSSSRRTTQPPPQEQWQQQYQWWYQLWLHQTIHHLQGTSKNGNVYLTLLMGHSQGQYLQGASKIDIVCLTLLIGQGHLWQQNRHCMPYSSNRARTVFTVDQQK